MALPSEVFHFSAAASSDDRDYDPAEAVTLSEQTHQNHYLPLNARRPNLLNAWNNLSYKDFLRGVKLQIRILDVVNKKPKIITIGYIERSMNCIFPWDARAFDSRLGSITLHPKEVPLEDHCEYIRACNEKFVEICESNQNHELLRAGIKPWLQRYWDHSKRETYYPVFSPHKELQELHVPAPARGIFGVPTAGVHMNAYSLDEKGDVQKIWVAVRSSSTTYTDCYDQIVAGGMDAEDNLNPWATMKREAAEEANLHVDINSSTVFKMEDQGFIQIGTIQRVRNIYFCTKKDSCSGSENGHVEPGVRFCFDLRVDLNDNDSTKLLEHNPAEDDIGGFECKTVAEVKESLRRSLEKTQWKPNCGLVMLDFLERKGLLDERDRMVFGDVKDLQKKIPLDLPFPDFGV